MKNRIFWCLLIRKKILKSVFIMPRNNILRFLKFNELFVHQ